MNKTSFYSHIFFIRGDENVKQKIEAVVTMNDKEEVRELMEDSLIQIIVGRINEFPENQRTYIFDKIIEKFKESS